jgi:hypothetical protein
MRHSPWSRRFQNSAPVASVKVGRRPPAKRVALTGAFAGARSCLTYREVAARRKGFVFFAPNSVGTIAPNRMRTCQYHVSSGEGTRRARECTATAGRLRADSRAPQSPRRGAEAASSVYTALLYGGVAARSRAVSPEQAGAHGEESSEVFGALKCREVQISRIPIVPQCARIFCYLKMHFLLGIFIVSILKWVFLY